MKKLLVTVNVLLLMIMVSALFGAGKTSTVQFIFATTASKSVSNPVADSSVGIKMHLSTNKTVPVGIKDNKSIDWIPAGEIWFSADITTTAPADQQYELKFYLINDTGDVPITSTSPSNLTAGATNKVKVVFQYPQVEFNLVKPPASHAGGVGITLHHATWSHSLGSKSDSYIDWIPVADYWFTADETIQKEGIKLKFSYNGTEITQNNPITFKSAQQYTVNIEFESKSSLQNMVPLKVGYWTTWGSTTLEEAQKNGYNVIILAFAQIDNSCTTSFFVDKQSRLIQYGPYGNSSIQTSKQKFISAIESVQSDGVKVLASFGGQNSDNTFDPPANDAVNVASSILKFLADFNLDGVDFDVETSYDSIEFKNILSEIRTQDRTKSILITGAPQITPNAWYSGLIKYDLLIVSNGRIQSYTPAINAGLFDALFLQLYNNNLWGTDTQYPIPKYEWAIPYNENDPGFISGIFNYLITKKTVPEKTLLVLGEPADASSASSSTWTRNIYMGRSSKAAWSAISSQLKLLKGKPQFGGVMVWDINEDSANDWKFSENVFPALY